MKTRIIHTQFWDDDFVFSLPRHEILLFNYLLTNDKVNIIGCYQIPDQIICIYTKITNTELQQAKQKFQEYNKIFFNNGWVLLRNFTKYETYTGEKNQVAKDNIEKNMPASIFDWYKKICDTPIDRGIDGGTMIPPINHKSKIINHKSESINQKNEKKFNRNWLETLGGDDATEIAKSMDVTDAYVLDMAQRILDYCDSKGKKYDNYLATLRNWIRRDDHKVLRGQQPLVHGLDLRTNKGE